MVSLNRLERFDFIERVAIHQENDQIASISFDTPKHSPETMQSHLFTGTPPAALEKAQPMALAIRLGGKFRQIPAKNLSPQRHPVIVCYFFKSNFQA